MGGRDTLQDTGLGVIILSTGLLVVFIFGFAMLLSLVFVINMLKHIDEGEAFNLIIEKLKEIKAI